MAFGDPRRWMWAEACALLEQAEQLHRQFFAPQGTGAGGASWEPPVDIFEAERTLWVIVALPGVTPEKVQVFMEANILVVVGHRRLPRETRGASIHRLELPQGRFERRIALPARQWRLSGEKFSDGCLILNLHHE